MLEDEISKTLVYALNTVKCVRHLIEEENLMYVRQLEATVLELKEKILRYETIIKTHEDNSP